jgi:hypothetical protein
VRLQSSIACVLALLIAVPHINAQSTEPPEVWRQYSERLAPGALVKVTLKNGQSLKGHVIQAAADRLRLDPKTRIRVPVRDVSYDDIAWMATLKDGFSPGTKVLMGVGIGAACIFGLFLVALAAISD